MPMKLTLDNDCETETGLSLDDSVGAVEELDVDAPDFGHLSVGAGKQLCEHYYRL